MEITEIYCHIFVKKSIKLTFYQKSSTKLILQKTCVAIKEKRETLSNQKQKNPWTQLFSNLFSKNVAFTKFFSKQKSVKSKFPWFHIVVKLCNPFLNTYVRSQKSKYSYFYNIQNYRNWFHVKIFLAFNFGLWWVFYLISHAKAASFISLILWCGITINDLTNLKTNVCPMSICT